LATFGVHDYFSYTAISQRHALPRDHKPSGWSSRWHPISPRIVWLCDNRVTIGWDDCQHSGSIDHNLPSTRHWGARLLCGKRLIALALAISVCRSDKDGELALVEELLSLRRSAVVWRSFWTVFGADY